MEIERYDIVQIDTGRLFHSLGPAIAKVLWTENNPRSSDLSDLYEKKPRHCKGPCFIQFLISGESTTTEIKSKGVLSMADDWEMPAYLRKQLRFPEQITQTSLRPDIVLWSKVTKQVVLIELTIHWEKRIEKAHEC